MKKQMAEARGNVTQRFWNRCLAIAAAMSLLLSVICAYVLPGVRFSAMLFIGAAGLFVGLFLLNLWAAHSEKGRVCRFAALCILAAGLLIFAAVETVILWAGERRPPSVEPGAVIVLGAGVNGTTPSLTLRTRIDAAAEYLRKHPEIPAVLSGGQGPGEDITEAQAMYKALVDRGIAPERLLLEEHSTSTAENMAFSRDVLQANGVDTTAVIAVVTNDFHQFRAQMIARENGLTVIGIPAELPWWWLNANYYVREFFALGKLWLFG